MNKHKYQAVLCVLLSIVLLLSAGCQGKSHSENCYLCGNEISGRAYQSDALGDTVYLCESCYNDLNDAAGGDLELQFNMNNSAGTEESSAGGSEMFSLVSLYTEGLYPVGDRCVAITGISGTSFVTSYIDKSGKIIYQDASRHDVLNPGENTYFTYSNGTYTLRDLDGKSVMELSNGTYSAFSTVSEGLFYVEEIRKSFYGDTTVLVYYDEGGNCVLSFDDTYSAGEASMFNDGTAFVYRIREESGDEKKDWYLINTDGSQIPVGLSDLSILTSDKIFSQLSYYGIDEDASLIGWEIETIQPFYEGENYAAVDISVEYAGDTVSVLGYVSKTGELTVLPQIGHSECYIDDCIMFSTPYGSSGNAAYNVKTNSIIDLDTIDLGIDLDRVTYGEFWLLDTGRLFLLLYMKNGNSTDPYGVLVSQDGVVLDEPKYLDKFDYFAYPSRGYNVVPCPYTSPYMSTDDLLQSEYSLHYMHENALLPCVGSQGDETFKTSKYQTNLDYYKVGYVNIWGEYVIEPQFTDASLFRNGYAVVATDYKLDEGPTGLYFINEAGELLESIG